MALQKSITNQITAVNNEYWKVTDTRIDWHNKTGEIVLSGFVNEQARLDGKKPTGLYVMSITEETMPTVDDNLVVFGYTYFKTLPEFDGAIDC